MNAWESIFLQSKVNNALYDEDQLPQQNWQWPQGTWLQTRCGFIRSKRPGLNQKSAESQDL